MRRSGSTTSASAPLATRSASAASPTRYSASASRHTRPSYRGEPAGCRATAWPSSSAAARGACPISSGVATDSQRRIHSSIGSVSADPSIAASSCLATRSAGAPVSASARAASRCQAARTDVGISSYSAVRISGCRKARPLPDSISTPAAQASSTAATSWTTLRPSTVDKSDTVKSTPSRAAARSTWRTQPGTKRSRSAMASDSESGAVSLITSAIPASVMVRPALRVSASISSVTYSGFPAAPSARSSSSPAGLPPARAVTRSVTAVPVRPSS